MICPNDWNDFYDGIPSKSHESETNRILPSSGSEYIRNSVFQSLSPSSNGGAVYCNSISLLFLVEKSSFISCKPSGSGGAIFLSITGESIINKVCGYSCVCSSSNHQFDYIQLSDDPSKRNKIHDSSVCHSIQKGSYDRTLQHNYGMVELSSVNVSQNECYLFSCIISQYQSAESNSLGFNMKFSSVSNNTARNYMCIAVYVSNVQRLIQTCNILYNKHSSSTYGIIYTSSYKILINNSCILGNTATLQVSEWKTYYSVISNCTLDFTSSSVSSGISIRDSPSTSFINKIVCISTFKCEAKYDSFGKLSVKPDVRKSVGFQRKKRVKKERLIKLIFLLVLSK